MKYVPIKCTIRNDKNCVLMFKRETFLEYNSMTILKLHESLVKLHWLRNEFVKILYIEHCLHSENYYLKCLGLQSQMWFN